MRLRVDVEKESRGEAIEALLPSEPYLAYAQFAPIAGRSGALAGLHRRWWTDAPDALVARDGDGQPLAALRVRRLEFESQHFGLEMAKCEPPLAVADEGRRLPALRVLYQAAAEDLRARGFDHLAAVTSTSDRAAAWVLQEIGGFHVGTRISWMQPLTGAPQEIALEPPLHFEDYDAASVPDLDPASYQRLLEWCRGAFDRGPYVFDLQVPLATSQGIYQVWTEKALRGEWAESLLVVRDRDEVVAFHSMLRLPDLSEAAGVTIVGRGIGASLPGYRGLFTALQRRCAVTRPLGASFLENEAQSSTIQSIQVFGKLGHRCIRSTASFHLGLRPVAERKGVACVPEREGE